jgi:PAS domain S-box-containing protein
MKRKIKIISAVAFLLFFVVSMDYAYRIFARRLMIHDYNHSRDVAMRVLDMEHERIKTLAVNLAQWDETYSFLNNPQKNQHYFDKNLPATVFENFGCDIVLFTNNEGKRLDYRYFNKSTNQFEQHRFIENGSFLKDCTSLLTFQDISDTNFGVLTSENDFLLTVAVPVTNTELSMPQNGILFFIKIISGLKDYSTSQKQVDLHFVNIQQADFILNKRHAGSLSFFNLIGNTDFPKPFLKVENPSDFPEVFLLLQSQPLLYSTLSNFRIHIFLSLLVLILIVIVSFIFFGKQPGVITKHTPKSSKIFIFAFLASGFVLVAVTSFSIRNVLIEERKFQIEKISNQFVREFQQRFLLIGYELDNLQRFFLSSDTVTRSEFRLFTENLLQRSSEIRSVSWIPVLNQHQTRDVERLLKNEGLYKPSAQTHEKNISKKLNFRYLYIEPARFIPELLWKGYHSPQRMKRILETGTSGNSPVSWMQLVVSENKPVSELIIHVLPVHNQVVKRNEITNSNGFLVAGIDMEIFLSKLVSENADFNLINVSLKGLEADSVLYSVGNVSLSDKLYNKSSTFKLHNTTFIIEVEPTVFFKEKYSDSRFWISLGVGVLAILMLSAIIYYRERNIIDIHDIVADKNAKPLIAKARFRWKIIIPIVLSLLLVSIILLMMARRQIFESESESSEQRKDFTISILADKLDYYAMVLERSLLFLSYDKAMAEAWDMNDYDELYDRTYEYFQLVQEQYKISDIQYIDSDNFIRLSLKNNDKQAVKLSPEFLEVLGERKVTLHQHSTGAHRFYGMVSPNGMNGRKILVSIDFDSIISELAGLLGFDVQVFPHESAELNSTNVSSKTTEKFGFTDFQTIKESLDLQNTHSVQYRKGEREYYCSIIPFGSLGLQPKAYLLVAKDVTNLLQANSNDYIKVLTFVFGIGLFLVLVVLLVVSRSEKQLLLAFHSYNSEVQKRADIERRISATLNSIGDAVISTDIQGNIVDLNPVAEKLTGFTSDSISGIPMEKVFRIFNSKTGQIAENPVNEVIKSRKAVNLANHIYLESKNGEKYHIADSASPIILDDGSLAGVVLVFRDVSEEYKIREALKENEQLFRTLTENSPIGVLLLLNNHWVYANDKAADITGYSQKELSEIDFWEFVHDEYKETIKQRGLARQKGGKVTASYDFKIITKKGKERWVHLTGASIEFKGERAGLVTMTDITEIKETRFEIDLLRTAIESTTNEVYIFGSQDLRFLYTNRTASKNLGFTALQMANMTPYDIIVNYSPNELSALMETSKKTKLSVVKSEKMHRRRDGSFYPVESSLSYFTADDVGYFVEIVTDISARKKAETQIAESERRYRMLFHDSHSVMLLVDSATKKIIDANQAACDYYGHDQQTLKKMNMLDFEAFEAIHFQAINHKSRTQENRESYSITHKMSNGQLRDVEVYMSLIQIEGNILEYLIVNDVTEKKLSEKELILAKEKAEESDKLKSAFLANMSHEIRTPLNGVIGFAKLLLKENIETEKRLKYSSVVVRSSNQLLRIVNDILDMSKIETGQITIRNSMFDLHELLHDVYTLFSQVAIEKGIALKIENTNNANQKVVTGDADKIRQIVTNLLHNALKFTQKGEVVIEYSLSNDGFRICVSDTGLGISTEAQSYIFENFRQAADDIAPKYGGTGLGLAICKGFVQAMNGKIWVESKPGSGSRFYVDIPKG